MSNGRKLRGAKRNPAVHCGVCGRGIATGRERIVLRDGRSVCGRCRDTGVLAQRLPCGHMGIPGTMVISDSADLSNFQCVRCSAESPVAY